MSYNALLIHTVVLKAKAPATVAARDVFGNRELVDDPDRPDVTLRARFELTDADENLDDRDLQRERYLVFLEAAAVWLDGNDELYWVEGARTLRLEGAPLPISDAIGVHHLEAIAYRTTG